MVETKSGGGWEASKLWERIKERKEASVSKAEGMVVKSVGEVQLVLVVLRPSRAQGPPTTPPKPRNLPPLTTLSARIAARGGKRSDGIRSTGEVRRVCAP